MDRIGGIMTVHARVGNRIRQMREEKGFSQVILAEKAMIAQSTLSYIEAGKKSPTLETLRAIGDGLGVSVTELLKCNENEQKNTPVQSSDKAGHDSLSEAELKKLLEFSEFIYKKFGKGNPVKP